MFYPFLQLFYLSSFLCLSNYQSHSSQFFIFLFKIGSGEGELQKTSRTHQAYQDFFCYIKSLTWPINVFSAGVVVSCVGLSLLDYFILSPLFFVFLENLQFSKNSLQKATMIQNKY